MLSSLLCLCHLSGAVCSRWRHSTQRALQICHYFDAINEPYWMPSSAISCQLTPRSPSQSCIRPTSCSHLCSCAALTFCLCLFESRPRSWVLVFASSAPQSTHKLSVVYQSQDLIPRLIPLQAVAGGHECHIISVVSLSPSPCFFLSARLTPPWFHTLLCKSPLISHRVFRDHSKTCLLQ